MKKITLVNQVTGPLFIDITNAFSNYGFETILHTGTIEETYASLKADIKIKKSKSYQRKNPILRIFTWSLFFIQVFFKLFFDKKDTPLLLVSNPPFAPFLGYIFYKLFKRPYFILVYDVYPDALVEFNYFSKNSWIVRMWQKVNRPLYLNAQKVFTISKGMEERIKRDNPAAKTVIIHNWVDSNFIKPIAKKDNWFVKEHGLENKTVVLYSGNLGITHDIEGIIEAAKDLRNNEKIQFVIIGSGAKEDSIKELVEKYKLKNVKLLPFQPSSTVPYSMTCGDISIVTLAKGAGDLSVPSKTYYMMAAGMAVLAIAEDTSEIADLVQSNKFGMSIQPHAPKELAKIIQELSNDSERLNDFRENALQAAKSFTPKNADLFVEHCSH